MSRPDQKETEGKILDDLRSLGLDLRRKSELNDQHELAELADNLKQSMLQDFKTTYSENGHKFEVESKSTTHR